MEGDGTKAAAEPNKTRRAAAVFIMVVAEKRLAMEGFVCSNYGLTREMCR